MNEPLTDSIPEITFANLFHSDPLGEEFWKYWLGNSNFEGLRPHFDSMGERGSLAEPLSDHADHNGPVLESSTKSEHNSISYCDSYHQLEELAYGGGIISLKYDPKFLAQHKENRHLIGFASGYYFAQTETSLYCPVCMTDGVARVLELYSDSEIAKETIAHLTTNDMSKLWQGAMFLTERQGGSDVGTNIVEATNRDGKWYLNGEKWFCSNATAKAILVLARMPNGPSGTKGLGLFLALRSKPKSNDKTIRIDLLKEKLGVRSMATAEITLINTEAHLIGGQGEGFRQMTEMLNLSRLYNSVASVAIMRRCLMQALAHGSQRVAFGKKLTQQPLWRAEMSDLLAEQLASFAMVFETVRSLDRADAGDAKSQSLIRILTPITKALSGKLVSFIAGEAMELIGGNAYIEDCIMPRLLRDAYVMSIWEGTTNILSLDCLRVISKSQNHLALLERINDCLSVAEKEPTIDKEFISAIKARALQDKEAFSALAGKSAEQQQLSIWPIVESVGRTFSLALLLESAAHPPLRASCLAAFARLIKRPHAIMPLALCGQELDRKTEGVLLRL